MHFQAIDGLRAVAAYTVVVAHFLVGIPALRPYFSQGTGQIGVMLFFVISGFLMGALYLQSPITPGAVGEFYRKRVARVFPLYLIVVLASWASFKVIGPNSVAFIITDQNILQHALFIHAEQSILWTVPVEVQFYALFPLIWLAYSRVGASVLIWLALASVATLAAKIGGHLLITHLPFFLAGIAVSLVPPNRRGSNCAFLACAVLYVLMLPGVLGDSRGAWFSPVYLLLMPALLWSAVSSGWASATLGSPLPKFLGDASYSAYLLHIPLLKAAKVTPLAHLPPWAFFAACIALIVLMAQISLLTIERPLRRYISGSA